MHRKHPRERILLASIADSQISFPQKFFLKNFHNVSRHRGKSDLRCVGILVVSSIVE